MLFRSCVKSPSGANVPFDQVYQVFKYWHASTHGDRKNYITENKLCEAARSNGYIVTNGYLVDVNFTTNMRAITNIPSSTGALVIPNRNYKPEFFDEETD